MNLRFEDTSRIEELISGLNEQQREAVLHGEGPLLVLAGAGSGKTRVITYRIVKLILMDGVAPEEILAVTFTNKAAAEMRERISNMLPDIAHRIIMGTFHSVCVRMLRYNAGAVGLEPNFTIYDADDQKVLARKVLEDAGFDKGYMKPVELVNRISLFKTSLKEPEDIGYGYEGEIFAPLYAEYQKRLRELNAVDFGDLILLAVKMLRNNEEIRNYYNRRWKYVLVDEFQDTNKAQLELIKLLTLEQQNICVVGDDDQSIYSWRGARVENILQFHKLYKNTKIVTLDKNYRSTQPILECANHVISANETRHQKRLWTDRIHSSKPVVFGAENNRREAEFIADTIATLRYDGLAYKDIAILYRSNYQSRMIEDVLNVRGIPYQIVSGTRFYDRKEIKDMIAYLRLLFYPDDDVSFLRIVNSPPRGIGNVTVGKLTDISRTNSVSLLSAAYMARDDEVSFGAGVRAKIAKFLDLYETMKERVASVAPSDAVRVVYELSGYKQMLSKGDSPTADADIARMENIMELAALMEEHEAEGRNLQEILDLIALRSDADTYRNEDSVTMMTVHAAKGLEFEAVFVTGLTEGSFPVSRSENTDEERRLCYVAMTRAKSRLYMSWVYNTFNPAYSDKGFSHGAPSRFLKDIPSHLVEIRGIPYDDVESYLFGRQHQTASRRGSSSWNHGLYSGMERYKAAAPGRPDSGVGTYAPERITPEYIRSGKEIPKDRTVRPKVSAPQDPGTDFVSDGKQLQKGDLVYHSKFGIGKVARVVGKGPDATVHVIFPGKPMRKLKARFLKRR